MGREGMATEANPLARKWQACEWLRKARPTFL